VVRWVRGSRCVVVAETDRLTLGSITAWNDDPKPFRWTKIADKILDSIAEYMARISGATH
jgi:hypothetical protein